MLWLILGYLALGLLLMDYMCPCWPFFEKLVGAVIWPVSLAIGIRTMIRKRSRDHRMDTDLILLMGVYLMAAEAQKKLAAEEDDFHYGNPT